MSLPMTTHSLKNYEKGNGKGDPFPGTGNVSSLPKHCPLHGTLPQNAENTNHTSGISCCLSGCCCYVKRHSKVNSLLIKLSETKLCSDTDLSSHKRVDGNETWCRKRTKYYQQRLKVSDATHEEVLKQMKKKDLERLLSTIKHTNDQTQKEASTSKVNTKQQKRKLREYECSTENCVRFDKCNCNISQQFSKHDQTYDDMLRKVVVRLPHVMVSCLFRWPDLLDGWPLEQLCKKCFHLVQAPISPALSILKKTPSAPCSREFAEGIYENQEDTWVCCNPFHWSRILSDPHPIRPQLLKEITCEKQDNDKDEITAHSTMSYSTHGDQWDPRGGKHNCEVTSGQKKKNNVWCQLAYWEECQRVGPLQQISNSYIHVLQSEVPSEKSSPIQATKVPSSKKPLSTSTRTDFRTTYSKETSLSPLSKICDRCRNLNIIDSESYSCEDKKSRAPNSSYDNQNISSINNRCISDCSKSPKSVIKEKKPHSKIVNESSDRNFEAGQDEDKLYLSSLFDSNLNPSYSTNRTRYKIGKGIILSHEQIHPDLEEKTQQQYSPIKDRFEVGSPPYEKTSDCSTKIDEDLPPYSLYAQGKHGKRRKKHGSGETHASDLHSISRDDDKNQDCSNYQMDNGGESVWLHNLSQVPVFVTSPTLEPIPSESNEIIPVKLRDQSILSLPSEDLDDYYHRNSPLSDDAQRITPVQSTKENNQKDFTVHKILPGYAIKVFDYKKSQIYETARKKVSRATRHSNPGGPFDPHAIRISFAKGWSNSQGYSRSDITNCPCWIEVHLVVPQTTQQGKKYPKICTKVP